MTDAEEIQQKFKEWAELEATGDLEAWAQLISDDVELLPPGEPAVRGKEDVRNYARELFKLPIAAMEPDVQRVIVSESGDLAVNFGDLKMVLNTPEGPSDLDLKCLAVWQKSDGEWRIVANTWSSNTSV